MLIEWLKTLLENQEDVRNQHYGNDMKDWIDLGNPMEDRNCRFAQRIRMTKVNDALRRMKMRKLMGPDEIPIEIRKCLGDVVYVG